MKASLGVAIQDDRDDASALSERRRLLCFAFFSFFSFFRFLFFRFLFCSFRRFFLLSPSLSLSESGHLLSSAPAATSGSLGSAVWNAPAVAPASARPGGARKKLWAATGCPACSSRTHTAVGATHRACGQSGSRQEEA